IGERALREVRAVRVPAVGAVDRLPDAGRPGDHVVTRRRRARELVDLVREDERQPVPAPRSRGRLVWAGRARRRALKGAVLALHEHALPLLRLDASEEAVAADALRPLAADGRTRRARAELAVGRAVVLRA